MVRYGDGKADAMAHYDLVVCGAGPGGVGAALSAARLGQRVLLIDQAGCVGGYWTSGLMGIALDMPGKGGIPLEILQCLLDANAAQWVDERSYTYDIEAMKHTLEQLLTAAGVDILLYTALAAVKTSGRRIVEIETAGFQSMRFSADFWVDGTGHGTLGMLAGCTYASGHPDTGLMQPGSLHAVVTGVPDAWQSDIHNRTRKQALYDLLASVGVTPSYAAPLLFQPKAGVPVWILAINHQYAVNAEDAKAVSSATIQAREEINRAVTAVKTLPGWEQFSLCATAEQIGLRDSRRIQGLYTLTVDDGLQGRAFPDGVVPIHSCIDVHQLTSQGKTGFLDIEHRFLPFQVPLRSLIAAAYDNLFLVGRCISGDFITHSAYRMTTSACAMGEAVGIAAGDARATMRASNVDGVHVKAQMQARGYELK